MAVGGQVGIIQARLIGAPDVAGVVQAVPCGLLPKGGGRAVRSGAGRACEGGGWGVPRPHLVPHRLPAQQGDICLLHTLGVLELPVGHAAAVRAGGRHLQGQSAARGGSQDGGTSGRGRQPHPAPTHRPSVPSSHTVPFPTHPPFQRLGLHPPQGLKYPDSPHPSGPAQAQNLSLSPIPLRLLPGSPAAYPGAQNPLIHSAEASLPLGAPGHLGQELVPLRHRAAAGGRSRPPALGPKCPRHPSLGDRRPSPSRSHEGGSWGESPPCWCSGREGGPGKGPAEQRQ